MSVGQVSTLVCIMQSLCAGPKSLLASGTGKVILMIASKPEPEAFWKIHLSHLNSSFYYTIKGLLGLLHSISPHQTNTSIRTPAHHSVLELKNHVQPGLEPITFGDGWSSPSNFFKDCPCWGQTWDLSVFVYFLCLKQHLRPFSYCAPFLVKIFSRSSKSLG